MRIRTISRMAKLPFDMVKGTNIERDNRARNLVTHMSKGIEQHLIHNDITVANFRRILRELIPKPILLLVDKNEDKSAIATMNILSEANHRIYGFELDFNPISVNRKVSILDLPTIVHEIQHFADFLFHPKFLSREQSLCTKNLYTDKYEKFFDDQLYIKEEFFNKKDKIFILNDIKRNIKKFLRNKSAEDKLDYLQYMRYCLILEDRAYRTQYKFAKHLSKKKFEVNEEYLTNPNKEYMFEEKIKLLEQMIYDFIKSERGKHHAKLKRKQKLATLNI